MAKKVREQALSLSSYLKSVNSEDISENQDVQRMFCWGNEAINELIITVLTEDYIPPIILGEEELGGDLTQQYIVDGIQRTTALNMFRHMNWKTTKSFENSVIQYQAKRRDENGHLIRGEDGSILWDSCEFDIRNKTFDQLPDELKKKFDDYQIRIVIHQNCTMQEISKLVRRYNRNRSMGSNQKALTWIPTYARKIKNIANNEFYKNCVTYSKAMRVNGTYEQTVANSVMATFHLDDWKKSPKDRNEFLEENSSFNEFEKVNEYGNRIAKVCGDKFQNIFVFKDILVWVATFHKFTKFGLEDSNFAEFINELANNLHSKFIDEWSYDTLDKEPGTSDKKVVQAKIDTYTALMMDYLHITEDITENKETENEIVCNADESDPLQFIKDNVSERVSEEDIDDYYTLMDDFKTLHGVNPESPFFDYHNELAFLGMIAYSFKFDKDLDNWLIDYTNRNITYSTNQTENLENMIADFKTYEEKKSA